MMKNGTSCVSSSKLESYFEPVLRGIKQDGDCDQDEAESAQPHNSGVINGKLGAVTSTRQEVFTSTPSLTSHRYIPDIGMIWNHD
jgi:hypothetical protein